MAVMEWHNRRKAFMTSAFHDSEMKTERKRGREKQKPVYVTDYNK
jgi:hypothetical protein